MSRPEWPKNNYILRLCHQIWSIHHCHKLIWKNCRSADTRIFSFGILKSFFLDNRIVKKMSCPQKERRSEIETMKLVWFTKGREKWGEPYETWIEVHCDATEDVLTLVSHEIPHVLDLSLCRVERQRRRVRESTYQMLFLSFCLLFFFMFFIFSKELVLVSPDRSPTTGHRKVLVNWVFAQSRLSRSG